MAVGTRFHMSSRRWAWCQDTLVRMHQHSARAVAPDYGLNVIERRAGVDAQPAEVAQEKRGVLCPSTLFPEDVKV